MSRKKDNSENTTGSLNFQIINEKLENCPDIIRKKVYIDNKHEAYFIYIRGLTDKDLIQRDFISPIIAMSFDQLSAGIAINNIPCAELNLIYDPSEVVDSILSGNSVFICNALPFAVSCMLSDIEKRSIDEPITEKNVRGPHEGFVEVLDTNLSILRRKIKNSKLKYKTLSLGLQTNQQVVISYMEGLANEDIINSLYKKLSSIKIDGLSAIGYIEQIITSHPNSLFPQFIATERPDRAMAALLEGRLVILQEGTPVVLIAPVSFISFFQALDDFSTLWTHGSFIRLLRIAALVITLLLPSLYIAVTSFHYYAVPLHLLVPLAESRSRVPFPPIIEVLILEATVEMVREASIRLPSYIGTAISVVAGLIIGEAAVQAGIVSDLLIVIVAATAVASYVIPTYDMAMAIRILRFLFILASSVFGIIGIVVCTALTFAHMITMESLGQPYFQPFSPLNTRDFKDSVLRMPLKVLRKRPNSARTKNNIRSRNDERNK
ncbi:MAG: spore germination protein [Clostridia bacterium]|nr:spore germination protein [Clostridia bacterium]